jgi:hypothetical protein
MAGLIGSGGVLVVMLSTEGMRPVGMGLQDPCPFCVPLVSSLPWQKFIKLFLSLCQYSRQYSETHRQLEVTANSFLFVDQTQARHAYVFDLDCPDLTPCVPSSCPVRLLARCMTEEFRHELFDASSFCLGTSPLPKPSGPPSPSC